jgi:hypothetical protein
MFGQRDHVRRYGWDYLDRIRRTGLSVDVIRLEDELSDSQIARYKLTNLEGFVEPIIVARTPAEARSHTA